MNLLDFIILTPLVFALGRGIYKGLINELASLVALFLGIFLAYKYAAELDAFLSSYLEDAGEWTLILSYALIFIGVFLIIMLLSRSLTQIAGILALGIINRILGGIFGFIKMLLIILILVHLAHPVLRAQAVEDKAFFQESLLYEKLLTYSRFIGEYIHFSGNADPLFQEEEDLSPGP